MNKAYSGKVPICHNKDGSISLVTYYNENWNRSDNIELVDNYVFKASLKYTDYYKGQSSVQFIFESDHKDTYYMFMTNMNDLLKSGCFSNNIIGYWTFVKRGANYGIVYLGETNEE